MTNQPKAPTFELQNTEGKSIRLSRLFKNGPAVLLFFPLAFTGTCTEEMCTMRDNMKFYESLDATVAGISVDSFFTLEQFKKSQSLNFMLLSDFNKDVSKAYGTLQDDFYGMKGVSKRAAFVISKEGTIVHQQILDDAGKLPNFEDIKQALSKVES